MSFNIVRISSSYPVVVISFLSISDSGRVDFFLSISLYLGVGSVGAELVENERVDEAHVAGHLLHPPQLPLLLRVGEFHHQARRSTLTGKRETIIKDAPDKFEKCFRRRRLDTAN